MSQFRLFEGSAAAGTIIVGLFLVLQGCASFPPPAGQSAVLTTLSPTADAKSSPLVAWASTQSTDRYSDVVLDDPAFGRNVSVRMESYYLSAMGLPCRRARVNVVVNGPPAETVAVCQDSAGSWFLAPRIWKSSVAGSK